MGIEKHVNNHIFRTWGLLKAYFFAIPPTQRLKSLLGNASEFTMGFTTFLNEFGDFYLVKLFNPLKNGH
jgi:hypothetical protein